MNCIQSGIPSTSLRQRCLIVGYGSIGARHATLLSQKGQEVACVTHRTNIPFRVFQKLKENKKNKLSFKFYLLFL